MIGAGAWVAVVSFFILEQLVRTAWVAAPYTLHHFISDLAATTCGVLPYFHHLYVCSPEHVLMNGAFISSGVLALVGIVLLAPLFPRTNEGMRSRLLLGIAAMCYIGVGIFPEDHNIVLHLICAVAYVSIANIGLVLLGRAVTPVRPVLGRYTVLCGVVGLMGIALTGISLLAQPTSYVGITERISVYPFLLWLITVGGYILFTRRGVVRS